MNALIKQTLEQHAEEGPTPYVDVAALEAAGRQRVRRRRVAGGVGALAVLAVVGVATPYLVAGVGDGADQGQVAVDGAASVAPLSWAIGTTVRVGEGTVELPGEPVAYVLTDDGVVWTDAEQGVNLTGYVEGDRTRQIGVSTPEYGRVLVAEGSLAAWYDGNEQAFTVVDTRTARLVRQVPVVLDGPQGGEFDGPTVISLNRGVLWSYADREVMGIDTATGDGQGFGWEATEDLGDARAGYVVLNGRGRNSRVVTMTGDEVGAVPGGGRALLSPDAAYVVTDPNDSEQVWDVATGEDVTPAHGYDFLAVAQWLDDDRFQALALDVDPRGRDTGPTDFLVCSVSAGDCDVVADDVVAPNQVFQIPIGESLG